MRKWPNLANALLFNLSWLAIVLTQSPVIAPLVVAMHLLLHGVVIGAGHGELRLIAGVTLGGAILDQALFRAGVFNLAGQPALAPLWLACLWPVFATTLMHSFAVLQNRIVLAAACGAVGGALSYIAGVRLSAIEFASTLWGPVLLALLWAAIFPLLLQVAARLQGRPDALQAWHPRVPRAFD
jgi:hypothetical protein